MHPPFSPIHLVPLVRVADALLRRGVRWTLDDPDALMHAVRAGRPVILVCRHGQLWPALWAARGTATEVLVSHSEDGELLARLLGGWGFGVARGSSSRAGFSGARGALRALRAGRPVGLAVDGPRGPRGEVQEGALRLARRAAVSLVPLSASGSGRWVLRRTWDHFEIPCPPGRVRVRVGPAIEVGPGPEGLLHAARALSGALGETPAGPAPQMRREAKR